MLRRHALWNIRVAAIAMVPALAFVAPAPAFAQSSRINVPAMPLEDALAQIRQQTGAVINVDPDAVRGLQSRPVRDARSALAAVRQATRGLRVALTQDTDGAISILNDIVVIAHRDEAETNVMVRSGTTSTRTGESLRDQPRNAQVISAKLLAEQQAQSLPDALRNAGGVTVNAATVQGGTSFTVRGFSSGGAINGLPTPASSQFAAGSTQPIANIERVEVLKGPDAILLGAESLGGTVNIATKKPSADERLYVSAEAGSFGAGRITVDANRAITADGKLSGRVIATAADADHNYGGYRGNEDYLFAPSLRFKNAGTDIIASITVGNQVFGTSPYTIFDDATNKPLSNLPRNAPIIGGRDQFAQIKSAVYDLSVSQDVSSWLTVAGHWQHQDTALLLSQYSPFVVIGPNTLLGSRSGVNQHSANNAVDGYARIKVDTGPVQHKLVVGSMANNFDITTNEAVYNDGAGGFFIYNYVTRPALGAAASRYTFSDNIVGTQTSYYAQYLAKVWKMAFTLGLRRTMSRSRNYSIYSSLKSYRSNGATTPSYGVVVEVTDNLSVYGSLAYGFRPSFQTDRLLNLLPDNRTRNAETGIKWDLFDKRILVNASWFKIRESNLQTPDPVNRRFQTAIPGQIGKGIDVSVQGEPLQGWLLSASLTRTDYSLLRPSAETGTIAYLVPRDQYSFYTSYKHRVADNVSAGLGVGVYGRSSAAIDPFGLNWVPPSNQVDLNGFLTLGKFDVNLGLRNLFDRTNYGVTPATAYVPLGEPRNWRLTVGYRFR